MSRLRKNCPFIFAGFLLLFVCKIAFSQSQQAIELNRQAVQLINAGRHNEAVEKLRQAMQLEPDWAEPHYNAYRLLRLLNRRDDMRRSILRAIERDPENRTYIREYTRILKDSLESAKQENNAELVRRIKREIVTRDHEEVEIGVAYIKDLRERGMEEDAYVLINSLIEKNTNLRTRYDMGYMGKMYLIAAEMEKSRNNISDALRHANHATKFVLPSRDRARNLVSEIRNAQREKVEELVNLAYQYNESGDQQTAIETLQRASEIDPNSERVSSAMEQIATAQDAAKAFADARRLSQRGEWFEAHDLLKFVVSHDPSLPGAKELLQQAERKENEVLEKTGMTNIPRTTQQRAATVQAILRRGTQLHSAGNISAADTELAGGIAIIDMDSGLEEFRSDYMQIINRIRDIQHEHQLWADGLAAREREDYQKVVEYLTPLPREYNIQLYSYLSEAYYYLDNIDKAMDYARLQLIEQPENNRARFIKASILLEQGNKSAALEHFLEIRASDPSYPGINDKIFMASSSVWIRVLPYVIAALLLWIAWAIYKYLPEYNKNTSIKTAKKLLKKGFAEECIEELIKIKRLPNLTEYDGAIISRLLAEAYLKKGIYDKAVGECKHLISINPKDEQAHEWLGYAYLGRRMLTPESLPELLNIYKKDKKNIALVSLLGSHYTQQKSLSKDGLAVLEQWLELDPNNIEVLKPLGKIYLSKGKSDDKAMKVFNKMIDLGTKEPEFMLGVAKSHLKLREFDKALKLCEEVINIDVNNVLVHSVLRETYQKQNRMDELLEIYRNFLQNNPYNVAFQDGLKEAQRVMGIKNDGNGTDASTQNKGASGLICRNCNKSNPSGEYYCQDCGKALS